jgi:CheY-like chemotaxis protein
MSDKPKKILIVDDDTDLLEQARLIVSRDGHEVHTAQGREEAEECLLSLAPDLAILDLMMEEKDAGFILAHTVKRLYPGTPVILLTAVRSATGLDFTARTEEAASWVKADLILDKPVRPEQLRAEVQRLLAAAR